jgi:hypothetical protein
MIEEIETTFGKIKYDPSAGGILKTRCGRDPKLCVFYRRPWLMWWINHLAYCEAKKEGDWTVFCGEGWRAG